MQLKINTNIRRSIITIELETINFTSAENMMLDQFGEPVLKIEKMYKGTFPVSINKKIRSNFKVRVKFDGTKDIKKASEAANEFIEEIREILPVLMDDFMYNSEDVEIKAGQSIETITKGTIIPAKTRTDY